MAPKVAVKRAMQKRSTSQKKCKGDQGQSSQRNMPPANPLTLAQENWKDFLTNNRTIKPSRWISIDAVTILGIRNSVELLLRRLDLWEFLNQEVPTYKILTIEFLSSLEFDKSTSTLTFNLGGFAHRMTAIELMAHLGFSTEDALDMQYITDFPHQMSEGIFHAAICGTGILTYQRAKNIIHLTLRYIQRLLAYTIFGRGETASVILLPKFFYLCCMLLQNAEESCYMPHLGYNLAKHFYCVATNKQGQGDITCGGVITKIALALSI